MYAVRFRAFRCLFSGKPVCRDAWAKRGSEPWVRDLGCEGVAPCFVDLDLVGRGFWWSKGTATGSLCRRDAVLPYAICMSVRSPTRRRPLLYKSASAPHTDSGEQEHRGGRVYSTTKGPLMSRELTPDPASFVPANPVRSYLVASLTLSPRSTIIDSDCSGLDPAPTSVSM
ncbi:hypothetical protein N7510_004356 [Penicillium lagena]|uniref:uncharacterized protein n=1 Tax=Penicillium lagena TaxID=94218 RepID=UPI00253F801F|nr:uncharacterized protein N7510_004356 [Penicillium lagena]KAJ5620372.1 hypothetical protein N7510_004356 [Penicillium lagena]